MKAKDHSSKNIKSYKKLRRCSDIGVVKLPETMLGDAILEKILFINVLELPVILLGVSYGEESKWMYLSHNDIFLNNDIQ